MKSMPIDLEQEFREVQYTCKARGYEDQQVVDFYAKNQARVVYSSMTILCATERIDEAIGGFCGRLLTEEEVPYKAFPDTLAGIHEGSGFAKKSKPWTSMFKGFMKKR